jgi:hypothetical protein
MPLESRIPGSASTLAAAITNMTVINCKTCRHPSLVHDHYVLEIAGENSANRGAALVPPAKRRLVPVVPGLDCLNCKVAGCAGISSPSDSTGHLLSPESVANLTPASA